MISTAVVVSLMFTAMLSMRSLLIIAVMPPLIQRHQETAGYWYGSQKQKCQFNEWCHFHCLPPVQL